MQFISLILLIIGIILITISYVNENIKLKDNKIEYRYIPRSFYDEQLGHIDLSKTYDELFMKSNPGIYGLDTKDEFILNDSVKMGLN